MKGARMRGDRGWPVRRTAADACSIHSPARRRAVAMVAGLAAFASLDRARPALAAAAPFDLPTLLAALARVERSTTTFEETRRFAVLSTPVVRRGTLTYVRPDRLVMDVVAPFPETTEIVGTKVRVKSSEGAREWDLAGQAAPLAWIEAIRASLAGDAAALARHFKATLAGSADAWTLALVPVEPAVAKALARVDVRGRGDRLTNVDIVDAQGDRVELVLGAPPRGGR